MERKEDLIRLFVEDYTDHVSNGSLVVDLAYDFAYEQADNNIDILFRWYSEDSRRLGYVDAFIGEEGLAHYGIAKLLRGGQRIYIRELIKQAFPDETTFLDTAYLWRVGF